MEFLGFDVVNLAFLVFFNDGSMEIVPTDAQFGDIHECREIAPNVLTHYLHNPQYAGILDLTNATKIRFTCSTGQVTT